MQLDGNPEPGAMRHMGWLVAAVTLCVVGLLALAIAAANWSVQARDQAVLNDSHIRANGEVMRAMARKLGVEVQQ